LSYFESRLRVNLENINVIKKKLDFYERLGVKNLILEPRNNIRRIPLELKKKIENVTKINVYYRITLKPSGLNELKNSIKEYNNFTDLLSVETLDKETQLSHILASINTVKSWEFEAQVIGLWVDENWRVAIIAE